jgi:hypothetical protein
VAGRIRSVEKPNDLIENRTPTTTLLRAAPRSTRPAKYVDEITDVNILYSEIVLYYFTYSIFA